MLEVASRTDMTRIEAEPWTYVNVPLVLVNRCSLYVIIAALGASILGCACILTYSFVTYGQLRENAEEVRIYIASQSKGPGHQKNGGGETSGASGATPARSATVRALVVTSPAAGYEGNVGMQAASGIDVSAGTASSDTSSVVARQEAPGTATLRSIMADNASLASARRSFVHGA